jgi:hypothetical protein
MPTIGQYGLELVLNLGRKEFPRRFPAPRYPNSSRPAVLHWRCGPFGVRPALLAAVLFVHRQFEQKEPEDDRQPHQLHPVRR